MGKGIAFAIAAMVVISLLLAGCAGGGAVTSGELYAAAGTAAARETAVAQATRDAYDNAARATAQALDNQQRQVAANATATAIVRQSNADATATAVQATQAAQDATSTATAMAATATMQAAVQHVELTARAAEAVMLQATAQAVQRREAVERVIQPVRMTSWVLFLLAGLLLLLWAGWQLLPVLKARLGIIRRDERGDPPVLAVAAGGGMVIFDPNRSWGPATVFTGDGVSQPLLTDPAYQDGTTKRGQFVDMAKGGRPRPVLLPSQRARARPNEDDGDEWQVEEQADPLPTRVPLLSLFQDKPPSLNDLVIGVTANGHGLEVVSASLHELMHVLAVGASGWGKSTWIRSLLWQVAQAREPVGVVAIDPFGSEFNILRDWKKLLFPVARTIPDAAAVLREVAGEIERRKGLFERYPLASKLTEYNRLADEPLSPWLVVFDEGTASLNRDGIGKPLRDAVQTARQYGIYIVLAGVSVKATVLDTETRDQFSTRLVFHVPPSSSRVVIDSRAASELRVKGRAYVQLNGRELLQIQSPMVSRPEFLRALKPGGPRNGMPEARDGYQSQAQRIRQLAEQGMSKRQIQREVFGYVGGAAYEAVTAVLTGGTTTETAVRASVPPGE